MAGMALNSLINDKLKDCQVIKFQGNSESVNLNEKLLLKNVLNDYKYSFFVIITAPSVQGMAVKSSKEIIDENSFVFKELGNFVASLKKAKNVPAVIIYDKSKDFTGTETLSTLPESLSGYYLCSSTTIYQEVHILRTFSVSKQLSIGLVEKISENDFLVINTVCHNILKSDILPEWPWKYVEIDWIYKEKMIKPVNGELVKQKDVHKKLPKIRVFYFFNWMIPLCRSFTNTLKLFYENVRRKYGSEYFEIFSCMLDLDKNSSSDVIKTLPWNTLKCSKEQMDRIKYTFGVSHVPSLVLLDENNDIITKNGRWLIGADPKAELFPFYKWNWYIDRPIEWKAIRPWNFYLIWDVPSLIVFGDAEDETYIDEWLTHVGNCQLLGENLLDTVLNEKQCLTKAQFVNKSALLLFKCIDDDEFLIEYGLADLGVPLAIIFDPYIGITICESEDMSSEILQNFVNEYKKGNLTPKILPVPQFNNSSTPPPNTSITLETHKIETN